jgi:hypothetical protein
MVVACLAGKEQCTIWGMEEAKNSIVLQPEGYALVTLTGKQTFMSMDALGKECKKLADKLKAQGKPLLGLVDFTQDLGFDAGTNKAVLKALEEIEYDRIALFGENVVLAEVTRAVVAALGKDDRTKVFKSRDEALAWLLMKDPVHGY